MKTLFLITGAVCSGKTTLAKQIGSAFNIPIFNEDIYGTFESCLNNLKNCEQNHLLLERSSDLQTDILNQASKLTCDIIEINNTADYELALNSITKSVALRLPKNLLNKKVKHNLNIKQTKQFKDKYFAYYDDVKSNTHEVYDW